MLFMSCDCHAFESVYCCPWSPDLLALVCDVYCGFVTFPCGILGQVWYLIVSIPDFCRLSYFVSYKLKNVHEVLVNCLFKLAQEKSVVR